jgi:hypothetical protein
MQALHNGAKGSINGRLGLSSWSDRWINEGIHEMPSDWADTVLD